MDSLLQYICRKMFYRENIHLYLLEHADTFWKELNFQSKTTVNQKYFDHFAEHFLDIKLNLEHIGASLINPHILNIISTL